MKTTAVRPQQNMQTKPCA